MRCHDFPFKATLPLSLQSGRTRSSLIVPRKAAVCHTPRLMGPPLWLVNALCVRARSFHRCCRARLATSFFCHAVGRFSRIGDEIIRVRNEQSTPLASTCVGIKSDSHPRRDPASASKSSPSPSQSQYFYHHPHPRPHHQHHHHLHHPHHHLSATAPTDVDKKRCFRVSLPQGVVTF